MMTYLSNRWEAIRTSFWFVPSLMMFTAAVLVVASIWIDQSRYGSRLGGLDWMMSAGAEGARVLISTIAGSMITVAGVVFSMTVVVLSLASSQLGPRLLRNFMRAPSTQMGLGIFTSTFLYCLLLLTWLQTVAGESVTLRISLSLAVVLALASLLMLVHYIHHVSIYIQAETVIQAVSDELGEVIDRLFPDPLDLDADGESTAKEEPPVLPPRVLAQVSLIAALDDGYLQAVNVPKLVDLAQRMNATVALFCHPGHYLVSNAPIAQIWPCQEATPELAATVNGALVLGSRPTPEQDVEFSIRQLVEVALRALSPGINDPYTAVACVDRLTSALSVLARREVPDPCYRDQEGRLRVVLNPVTFPDILDAAFNQIRQYGYSSVAVTVRVLEGLATLAGVARRDADRSAIGHHAEMMASACLAAIDEAHDRAAVEARHETVKDLLGEAPPASKGVVVK